MTSQPTLRPCIKQCGNPAADAATNCCDTCTARDLAALRIAAAKAKLAPGTHASWHETRVTR